MPVPLASGDQAVPGFAIYQFGANIYYAKESRVSQDILGIVKNARPPLKWLCLSASMISDIDYSGLESLKQLQSGLKKRGVELVLSDVKDHVRKQLRDMFIDQIGKDRVFNSFYDAVVAYKTLHEGS